LKSINGSRRHLVPVFDEVANLDLARDFKDRGSPIQVVTDYFRGRIKEDNRHPLYPMILSGSMKYLPEDFTEAKMLNQLVGLALIVSAFILSTWLWGIGVGCLSALFLGISPIMAYLSNQATADLLFAYFYFASLAILMKFSGCSWAWLVYGVTCGLSYLTKGNGHFLLIPPVILGLWQHKQKVFKKPDLYLLFLGFALVSSFLIVRNLSVSHNPFHNVNTKVFWLDSWTDYYLLSSGPDWDRVGLSWYLSHHSFSQIFLRLMQGIQATGKRLLLSMGVGPNRYLVLSGWVMLGLAVFGLVVKWRDRAREQTVVVGVTGILFFLLFCWYGQGAGADVRFVFPVAASLLPFSSIGVIRLYEILRKRLAKLPSPRMTVAIGGFLVASAAVILERDALGVNPRRLWYRPAEWQQTTSWIRERLKDQEFLQNNWSDFSMWDCCRDRRRNYPFNVSAEVLRNYVMKSGVKFILVDQRFVADDPFKEKYGPLDQYGPTTFLGWPRRYHDDQMPSLFVVYSEETP
jgi:4-amino-4-deoxy-L-arabinose transferase-like glycosyltransferase